MADVLLTADRWRTLTRTLLEDMRFYEWPTRITAIVEHFTDEEIENRIRKMETGEAHQEVVAASIELVETDDIESSIQSAIYDLEGCLHDVRKLRKPKVKADVKDTK